MTTTETEEKVGRLAETLKEFKGKGGTHHEVFDRLIDDLVEVVRHISGVKVDLEKQVQPTLRVATETAVGIDDAVEQKAKEIINKVKDTKTAGR